MKEFSFSHLKIPLSDETVYSDNTCPYSTYQDLRLAEIQYFISTFLLVYYWKCCHLIGYLLSVLDRKQVAKQLFSLKVFYTKMSSGSRFALINYHLRNLEFLIYLSNSNISARLFDTYYSQCVLNIYPLYSVTFFHCVNCGMQLHFI